MKKIIGSPIGLGEINLTVDNRVRRNIKEYFGNVDNSKYAIKPIPPLASEIKDVEYDRSKVSYIKIGVKAPKELLNQTFIIDLPNKYEFFIPINKNGDWLESELLFMSKDSFDIIKDQKNPKFAKLPTTDTEKEAATVWEEDKLETQNAADAAELAAADKAFADEAGKYAAKETDKTSKPECEAQYCKKYIKDGLDGYCVPDYKDEQKNEKGELITGCVESDPSGCCISKSCKEKKGIWQTNDKKNLILVLSILCGVLSILMFIIVICRYYYYKKTGKGDHESITTTFPYSDYLKKSFVLGGICCLLLIPWALFEAKIVSLTVSCPEEDDKKEEEEDDDSCPAGKIKKTCADGTTKCVLCGKNKKFSTARCKCVPK